MNREAAMEAIVKRLTQNSTYRGLILLAAGIGAVMQPEHAVGITAAALSLVGAINIARTS